MPGKLCQAASIYFSQYRCGTTRISDGLDGDERSHEQGNDGTRYAPGLRTRREEHHDHGWGQADSRVEWGYSAVAARASSHIALSSRLLTDVK